MRRLTGSPSGLAWSVTMDVPRSKAAFVTTRVTASAAPLRRASGTVPTQYTPADAPAVNGGFALTMSRGVDLGFGWTREDLKSGFSITEINTSSGTSGRLAPIDSKHIAIAWNDGAVKAAIMTCSP